MDEERVTLEKSLSFSDAVCSDFGDLMAGVKEGETRTGKVTVADGASNEEFRGKQISTPSSTLSKWSNVKFPRLTPAFLEELGDFESEQELRDFVRDSLVRQADYRTQQELRKTVIQESGWQCRL